MITAGFTNRQPDKLLSDHRQIYYPTGNCDHRIKQNKKLNSDIKYRVVVTRNVTGPSFGIRQSEALMQHSATGK